MACSDCFCGRKEAEEAGIQIQTAGGAAACGPVDVELIVTAYENGEVDRDTFIKVLKGAK